MTLVGAAAGGSLNEFLAQYDASHANDATSTGSTLLLEAVGNTDVRSRLAIAARLLDDGADASLRQRSGVNALHVLFGARNHDFPREAVLARRLIAGGANVNGVAAKFGTPLQTLARNFAYSDEDCAPVYDVVFSQPNLNLTATDRAGRSVLDALRLLATQRPALVERAEQYAERHPARD